MKKISFDDLKTPIYDSSKTRNACMNRDGFIFHLGGTPAVFDDLIVRNPIDAKLWAPKPDFSSRTFEEHIQLINEHKLEKVTIICNDLSFILSCPSIKQLTVYPSDDAGKNFDFSPLYQMPNLRQVHLTTHSGPREELWYEVDYTKIKGLVSISAYGKGHNGYEFVPTLETLWLSNNKKHINLENISNSPILKNIHLFQCNTQTLDGISKFSHLETLNLDYNRSLRDISALASVSGTLKKLYFNACPKINDFSVLNSMADLEFLELIGNNSLPNLDFLQYMPKLKALIVTMNVENGDLSHCMKLHYAHCKNRKHYNIKDAQLPKGTFHSDNC